MEKWKDVVGFEGWYIVSSLGQVRRIAPGKGARLWKCLNWKINGRGYPCVALCVNGEHTTKTIHAIVAAAFIGPRPNGLDINHIDGDKTRMSRL